jgi:hypothetical protein
MQALVVRRAIQRTGGNLGGFFVFNQKKKWKVKTRHERVLDISPYFGISPNFQFPPIFDADHWSTAPLPHCSSATHQAADTVWPSQTTANGPTPFLSDHPPRPATHFSLPPIATHRTTAHHSSPPTAYRVSLSRCRPTDRHPSEHRPPQFHRQPGAPSLPPYSLSVSLSSLSLSLSTVNHCVFLLCFFSFSTADHCLVLL